MANRDIALAILEQIKDKRKGKVWKKVGTKTWIEVYPNEKPKLKIETFNKVEKVEVKEKAIKVQVGKKVCDNVRQAAKELDTDFRYLYRLLHKLEKEGKKEHEFKKLGKVKLFIIR